MVLIESITKHFGVNTALDSVSLTVSPGCIYGLVGTNGSGKSTLLRLISGVYSADGGQVTVDGEPVKLTPIEYNILVLLIKNQGKVFSIEQIYENIWNEEAIGADNTVAVHIRHIREKIEINPREPRYLKVVWGIGYKIEKM